MLSGPGTIIMVSPILCVCVICVLPSLSGACVALTLDKLGV